ncbi:MAG: pyridoxamine 5'-phosphate oxidase family protein [Balneolaceae bacterium]
MFQHYHQGELQVQEKAGVRDLAERSGKVISNKIPAGALNFIDKQPMVIVSSLDNKEHIWVSILAGKPGFMKAENTTCINFNLSMLSSSRQDIFWRNIERNSEISMLFIELSSRRRLRVNGTATIDAALMTINVKEAYPNCPKYIQRREIEIKNSIAEVAGQYKEFNVLNNELKSWIERADTFFVGSADDNRNLDVNHRGGNPGFIRIIGDNSLQIPDYEGNRMFNTFGNFVLNPGAGLLFVDFDRGTTLQMFGTAEILWDQDDPENRTGGSGRFWNFYINRCLILDSLKGLNWNFIDYSPHNP